MKAAVAATTTATRKATAKKKKKRGTKAPAPASNGNAAIEERLRTWRLAEAKRRGVPAFRILTDKTLEALAAGRPATTRELLSIPGIGMNTVEKHGAQIYRILHEGA
jgi:DNA topoisomerase-3